MFHVLEILLGLVLSYVGLQGISDSSGVKSLGYGLVAIAGLALAVHGILLFNVPDFFAGVIR
jgi:hypothetical protein